MNNANQGSNNRPKAEWSQISLFKDDVTGAMVVITKSDHKRPAVNFGFGSAHGKTGLFTPHNLVKYDDEKPLDAHSIRKFAEGLLRVADAADESLVTAVSAIQKTLPKQRHNNHHGRKPGEPGKTGKTARKKAAKMGAGKPANQPGA